MFRLSGILLIGFAVFIGALLFQTSQSVQRAEQEYFNLEQALKKEREIYRVLTAEWDYLNRPARLEKLTQNNLDLDAVKEGKTDFIAASDAIPEPRIPAIPNVKPQEILQYAQFKKTKSVKKKSPVIQNAERDNFYQIMKAKHKKKKPAESNSP